MKPKLFLCLAAVILGAPNRRAHDHLTDHNWMLEIEGVTQGSFAEVSGLDSETEVIEIRCVIDLSDPFYKWVGLSAQGKADPLDLELVSTDESGDSTRYRVIGAEVQSVSTDGDASHTEEIEMVVERIEKG
ncbi:MAG: hypothetical protein ACI8RZ_002163 [Myxococcota bacterium]|jgi:hypothetical protein